MSCVRFAHFVSGPAMIPLVTGGFFLELLDSIVWVVWAPMLHVEKKEGDLSPLLAEMKAAEASRTIVSMGRGSVKLAPVDAFLARPTPPPPTPPSA